jgi:hypothetical protein
LFFRFDKSISKKVPVNVNLNVNFKKQYFQKGKTKITPDSIIISGAESIVDTTNVIFTKKKKFLELDNSIVENMKLSSIKNVSFSRNDVNISFIVEEYTESNIKVPIRVINKPDSIVLRTFPNKNTISFLVALNDYDKIIPPQFDIVVDYKEIFEDSKLKVHLLKYPDYIKPLQLKPEYVEYIIEK